MGHLEKWKSRVADWKSSGQTSIAFCEGKPYTAGGLRSSAHLLRQAEQKSREAAPAVRLGRVVRRPAAATAPREPTAAAVEEREAVVIECGSLRVAVRPGFDRETLGTVLELIAGRGGAR
jgi:hypothetical protein